MKTGILKKDITIKEMYLCHPTISLINLGDYVSNYLEDCVEKKRVVIEEHNYPIEWYHSVEDKPNHKPCPICGKSAEVFSEFFDKNQYFRIVCYQCTYQTFTQCSEKDAWNAWNALADNISNKLEA